MAASLTLRVVSAPPTERAPPPLTLAGGRATIGRRDGNSWVLPDASAGVSREHAVIEGASGGWQIVDKSANGTFVNGQNVGNGNAWPLGAGDSLRIGGYEIAVEMEGGQEDFGRPAAGPATIGGNSFDLGDLARPDFGAPRAAPRGPSPLDPLAEERPPELPPSNDLFGELGDNRTPLSSGGAMADPFNAPEQRGLGVPPAEPFGAPPSPAGSPFGGPGPDNWGTPPSGNPDSFAAPAPPPQRSAFTNAPDPLAALPDPFDQAPPSPDDRHVPMPQSPFALQPVALPNPTGPWAAAGAADRLGCGAVGWTERAARRARPDRSGFGWPRTENRIVAACRARSRTGPRLRPATWAGAGIDGAATRGRSSAPAGADAAAGGATDARSTAAAAAATAARARATADGASRSGGRRLGGCAAAARGRQPVRRRQRRPAHVGGRGTRAADPDR